jgi:hypothetical protein
MSKRIKDKTIQPKIMSTEKIYKITSNNNIIILVVENNRVVKAPPIAKRFIQQNIERVLDFYKKQGNAVIEVFKLKDAEFTK